MSLKWFTVENTWFNLRETGWGNGYIILPKGHKYHGKHYDNIPIKAHGGLTFAESASLNMTNSYWDYTNIPLIRKDDWIIGFDTSHSGDNKHVQHERFVEDECKRIIKQLENEMEEVELNVDTVIELDIETIDMSLNANHMEYLIGNNADCVENYIKENQCDFENVVHNDHIQKNEKQMKNYLVSHGYYVFESETEFNLEIIKRLNNYLGSIK